MKGKGPSLVLLVFGSRTSIQRFLNHHANKTTYFLSPMYRQTESIIIHHPQHVFSIYLF